MMRVFAASGIGLNECAQIETLDDIDNKAREVILRQPVLYAGWQQVLGAAINCYEATPLCLSCLVCPVETQTPHRVMRSPFCASLSP